LTPLLLLLDSAGQASGGSGGHHCRTLIDGAQRRSALSPVGMPPDRQTPADTPASPHQGGSNGGQWAWQSRCCPALTGRTPSMVQQWAAVSTMRPGTTWIWPCSWRWPGREMVWSRTWCCLSGQPCGSAVRHFRTAGW